MKFEINKPSEGQREAFEQFIINSDDWFEPKLSSLTTVTDYASKLYKYGTKYICFEGNEIIGCCVAYINKAPEFSFGSFLIVNPQYEGLGIGLQLIAKAIQNAKVEGSEGFKLKMRSTNFMLLKFYKKMGFEITEKDFYPNSDVMEYELTKVF